MKAKIHSPGSRSGVLRWGAFAIFCLAISGAFFALNRRQIDKPRREALSILSELEHALTSSEVSKALPLIELPSAAAGSQAAQEQWLVDVLHDEVSAAGLLEIRDHARFGPLLEIFPEEAARWTKVAHVPASECVALRMERNSIRAEVVLHLSPTGFRLLRCNNVKQMAFPPVVKS